MITRRGFIQGSFAAVGVGAMALDWVTLAARAEVQAQPEKPGSRVKVIEVAAWGLKRVTIWA